MGMSPSPSEFILLDTYTISEYPYLKVWTIMGLWWLNIGNNAKKLASAGERKSLVLLCECLTDIQCFSSIDFGCLTHREKVIRNWWWALLGQQRGVWTFCIAIYETTPVGTSLAAVISLAVFINLWQDWFLQKMMKHK